jgi:hypothetical protein
MLDSLLQIDPSMAMRGAARPFGGKESHHFILWRQ